MILLWYRKEHFI